MWNPPRLEEVAVGTMQIWDWGDEALARVARVSGPEPRFMVAGKNGEGAESIIANDLRSLRRAFEIAEKHLGNPAETNIEIVLAAAQCNGLANLAPATHVDAATRKRLENLRSRQGAEDASPPQKESEMNMSVVHEKKPEVNGNGNGTATIGMATKTKGKKTKAKASTNGKPHKKKAKVTKPAKPAKAPAEPKAGRLSLLDAAAQILAEAKKPMNAKELIDEAKAQGLWESPAGKTPHATLSAAILRDIKTKGADSRFRRVGPGQWEATGK